MGRNANGRMNRDIVIKEVEEKPKCTHKKQKERQKKRYTPKKALYTHTCDDRS